jgi:hypothetical protein
MTPNRLFLLLGFLVFTSAGFSQDLDAAAEIAELKQIIRQQQAQINMIERKLDALTAVAGPPVMRTVAMQTQAPAAGPRPSTPAPAAAPAPVAEARTVGGFRFSGDYRFRFDGTLRSGNSFAPPVQSLVSRHRVRLNIDKAIDPRFAFHFQLSTGTFTNGNSDEGDFSGLSNKQIFNITEAYVDYRANANVSMRVGRMTEAFADNMRFLWDDDVRFNGFQQILRKETKSKAFKTVEFRAGEYVLTIPNVTILGATSGYVNAGYKPGQKVRSAMMVNPGLMVRGDVSSNWSQQIMFAGHVYRNPNQIQLASTAAGYPLILNPQMGLDASGPYAGTGNATTTPGGAIYHASAFQIVNAGYRVTRKAYKWGGQELPLWFDFQASRNVGASILRDAFMASVNLGNVTKYKDVRLLYQFGIKDANSMISQFTDDNFGTGTGVNVRTHHFRFDMGITRFLQWQNLFFIQNPRRGNNPAENFYVPVPRGANTSFRYRGHLAFTF